VNSTLYAILRTQNSKNCKALQLISERVAEDLISL
jgi:hypothetical protein